MIIIEGPNGSGKSTLAKQLSEKTGVAVIHSSGPPKTPEDHVAQLSKYAKMKGLAILNRTPWISHPIYEMVLYKREFRTSWPLYHGGMEAQRTPIVYCRPPDETIKAEIARQIPTKNKSTDYLQKLRRCDATLITAYDDFMDSIKNCYRYDWTWQGADLLVTAFVRGLQRLKAVTSHT